MWRCWMSKLLYTVSWSYALGHSLSRLVSQPNDILSTMVIYELQNG